MITPAIPVGMPSGHPVLKLEQVLDREHEFVLRAVASLPEEDGFD